MAASLSASRRRIRSDAEPNEEDWVTASLAASRHRRTATSSLQHLDASTTTSGPSSSTHGSLHRGTVMVSTYKQTSHMSTATRGKMISAITEEHKSISSDKLFANQHGMAPSKVRSHSLAATCRTYGWYKKFLENLITAFCMSRSSTSPVHRLVYARSYRYDGAKARVGLLVKSVVEAMGKRIQCLDRVVGPQELLPVTATMGCVLQRFVDGAPRLLFLLASMPTYVCAIDSTKGECLNRLVSKQLELDTDDLVLRSFRSCIDYPTCDEATGNMRFQRYKQLQDLRRRQALRICTLHKAKKVADHTADTLKPFDTRVIRLRLSTGGPTMPSIRKQARCLIVERFCIVRPEDVPTEAHVHRNKVYNLFFAGASTPQDLWRKSIVTQLFNGDIRCGRTVQHVETGCCKSASETLDLMLSAGVAALFPPQKLLMRQNWTGPNVITTTSTTFY